jgi:hypothetical protein
MKRTLISTIDRIQVVGSGALAAVAAYGILANGAWWHIGTVAICAAIIKASLADIKKEEAEK